MMASLRTRSLQILMLGLWTVCIGTAQERETTTAPAQGRQRVMIRSKRDGSLQPSYIIVPPGYNPNGPAVPLFVALHTWSYTLEQRHPKFETGATQRNWIYLFPNFRGVDDHAEACGSELAQQDAVDAVVWTRAHMTIDDTRIY